MKKLILFMIFCLSIFLTTENVYARNKYSSTNKVKIYISDYNKYRDAIEDTLDKREVKFVSSSKDANIVINISRDDRFYNDREREVYRREHKNNQQIDNVKSVDVHGNVISKPVYKNSSYTEIEKEVRSIYEIRGTVSITGELRLNKRINVEEDSVIRKTVYEGDIPSGLRDKNYGNSSSEYDLKRKTEREFFDKLEDILDDVYDDILYL